MSTLAEMVTEITDDLARPDLETDIRRSISRAIRDYAWRDWFFSKSRDCAFSTIVDRVYYDASDHALLPFLEKLHWCKVLIGSTWEPVCPADSNHFEELVADGTLAGEPGYYCEFGQTFGLFPADGVYDIRIGGIFKPAPPQTDDEAGNVWMTEARDLILFKAKYYVFRDKIRNLTAAETCVPSIEEQESILVSRSGRKNRNGRAVRVRPMYS